MLYLLIIGFYHFPEVGDESGALCETWVIGTIRQMENEHIIRPTARVLLLDEHERVLLFRGQDPANPNIRYWFPTGGGIEPDETAVKPINDWAEL